MAPHIQRDSRTLYPSERAEQEVTTLAIARHIVSRRFSSPEDAGWFYFRRALIDTYAVAVGAANNPIVGKVRQLLAQDSTIREAWVTTTHSGARADDAAFINGTAAHALDFDDVSPAVRGHPSTVLIPSILAATQPTTNMFEVAEAYAVGFEVGALLTEALPGKTHYAKGWHATATIGTIMAAAAVSRLRHLDVEHAARALSIAGSMASGSRQNFGTMTKPLHAGMAARNGITAAFFAETGVTASTSQIEGSFGFLSLFGDGPGPKATKFPSGPALLNEVGINIKRHPCCYYTHHAIDAALALRQEGIGLKNIKKIEIEVQEGGLSALPYSLPATGLEAKFSMPYCVVMALQNGVLDLDDFTDKAVHQSGLEEAMQRVVCREGKSLSDSDTSKPNRYAILTATTHSGETFTKHVEKARGDARLPLSEEEIRQKLHSCLVTGKVNNKDSIYSELISFEPHMKVGTDLIETLKARFA